MNCKSGNPAYPLPYWRNNKRLWGKKITKIQIPQTRAENYRNTVVNPVFQRNMKFWKKTDCWQISIGKLYYTVPVKMMLIQIEVERGQPVWPNIQVPETWRFGGLQADWWDFLRGGQQWCHAHRGTCTHTTPPRSSFPFVSTGLLRNLLATS